MAKTTRRIEIDILRAQLRTARRAVEAGITTLRRAARRTDVTLSAAAAEPLAEALQTAGVVLGLLREIAMGHPYPGLAEPQGMAARELRLLRAEEETYAQAQRRLCGDLTETFDTASAQLYQALAARLASIAAEKAAAGFVRDRRGRAAGAQPSRKAA